MGNSVYYMTKADLKKACEANRFIILTHMNGWSFAINTGIPLLGAKRKQHNPDDETPYIGYRPCGFSEYISRKARIVAS